MVFLTALFFAFVHNIQSNGFNKYLAVNYIAWPVSKRKPQINKSGQVFSNSTDNIFLPWLSRFIFCKNSICNNLCIVPTTKCTNCPHICPSVATKFFMGIPTWFMKACALYGVGKRHSVVQTCACTVPTVMGSLINGCLLFKVVAVLKVYK